MIVTFFIGITLVVFIKQKAKKPHANDSISVLIADGYKELIDDVKTIMGNK